MLPTKRQATHPGEVLQEEFITPMGITQAGLARHIGVHAFVINEIVHAKRGVTPRMAVMLARALGTSPEFWLGLQADYDLTKVLRTQEGKRVQAIQPITRPD
jgi:addiction module HigA family antidote